MEQVFAGSSSIASGAEFLADAPPQSTSQTKLTLLDVVEFFKPIVKGARYPCETTREDLESRVAAVLGDDAGELVERNSDSGMVVMNGDQDFGAFFGPEGDEITYRLIFNTHLNELRLEGHNFLYATPGAVVTLGKFASEVEFRREVVGGNDLDPSDRVQGAYAWPGLSSIMGIEDFGNQWPPTARLLARCAHLEDRHVRRSVQSTPSPGMAFAL
jgi:hypothetical protein